MYSFCEIIAGGDEECIGLKIITLLSPGELMHLRHPTPFKVFNRDTVLYAGQIEILRFTQLVFNH